MNLKAKLLSQDGLVVYTDWLVLNTQELRSSYGTLVWIGGTVRVPHDLPTAPDAIPLPENILRLLERAEAALAELRSLLPLPPPENLEHLTSLVPTPGREYLLRDDRGLEAFVTLTNDRPIAVFSGNVHRLPDQE